MGRCTAVRISIGGIARPIGFDPDANAAQLIAVLTRGGTGSLCLSRALRGTRALGRSGTLDGIGAIVVRGTNRGDRYTQYCQKAERRE